MIIGIWLEDVVREGSVVAAIYKWCANSNEVSCGVIGQTFATSGPGAGFTKKFDCNDYALRAFEGGALHYVDPEDGRMKSYVPYKGDAPGEVHQDLNGNLYTISQWTGGSVVRLHCPDLVDAVLNPTETAMMAKAVLESHSQESDLEEWQSMVSGIKKLAEAFEDIEEDDFDE
jgi:hypothetical protein